MRSYRLHRGMPPGRAALLAPLVPSVVRPLDLSHPTLPWPVAEAAFSLRTLDDLLGVYVATSYGVRLRGPEVDLHAPAPSDLGTRSLAVSKLPDGAALGNLLRWGSMPGPDGVLVEPSFAWVCRVLSLIHWASCPRTFLDTDELMHLPATALRFFSRCMIAPGGNLHALVSLAWRSVRDSAEELANAIEHPSGPISEPLEDGVPPYYPPRLGYALAGLGPVPGYPLRGWSELTTFEELASARDEFVWGKRSVGSKAEQTVHRLRGLRDTVFGTQAHRANRFESVRNDHGLRNWYRLIDHNLGAYSLACSRLLTHTVVAVRILCHIVHRLRVLYAYSSERSPSRPRRWAKALRVLADAPVSELDTFFEDLVATSGMSLPWLWYAEHELERVVRSTAGLGISDLWGVGADEPDSLDRAGASCPNNAHYVPPAG